MNKIKIASEDKKFKPFEIELKEYLMDTREDIMNMVFDLERKKEFYLLFRYGNNWNWFN